MPASIWGTDGSEDIDPKIQKLLDLIRIEDFNAYPHIGINLDPVDGSVIKISDPAGEPLTSVLLNLERIVDGSAGLGNPKNLRSFVEVLGTANTDGHWAISGEVETYNNSIPASEDPGGSVVAVSGTARKFGLGRIFAGHFNAIDNNSYDNRSDTTAVVAMEVDANGIGLDHPRTLGYRFGIILQARTSFQGIPEWDEWRELTAYEVGDIVVPLGTTLTAKYDGYYYECVTAGNSGAAQPTFPTTVAATVTDGTVTWQAQRGAECGTGLAIRTNESGSQGYWRNGIVVHEDFNGINENKINKGMVIYTTGQYGLSIEDMPDVFPRASGHTIADIRLNAPSNIGLWCDGDYTNAAIRIKQGQRLAFNNAGTIYMVYNESNDRLEFFKGATRRGFLEMSGADHAI